MNLDDLEDTTYEEATHDEKHEKVKPPSVEGEENPFSGDATSSESPDIEDQLKKVGLHGDEEGIKPLDVANELEEEEK